VTTIFLEGPPIADDILNLRVRFEKRLADSSSLFHFKCSARGSLFYGFGVRKLLPPANSRLGDFCISGLFTPLVKERLSEPRRNEPIELPL